MYLDCYILENFIINYIIIDCVTYITKIYTKKYRQILGAILGTIYSVYYLYDRNSLIYSFLFKIAFILFILFISFEIVDKKQFLKLFMYFYLVNIFLSGSMYFIIYFTAIERISISILIICTYTSCKLLKLIVNNIKNLNHLDVVKKEIKIKLFKDEINCVALLDSGNLLQDPISKDDVVIIEASLINELLETDIELDKIDISNIQSIIEKLEPKISNRIRIIPYKHVGSSSLEMLIGIKADYLEVDEKKISNIILGISNLNEEGYNAILNPRIL